MSVCMRLSSYVWMSDFGLHSVSIDIAMARARAASSSAQFEGAGGLATSPPLLFGESVLAFGRGAQMFGLFGIFGEGV